MMGFMSGEATIVTDETAATPELVLLRRVRPDNVFEETIERLLQTIRLGMVLPGERLPPERELAARLGISRATLRDATAALHQAGWVEVKRGRSGGTFVRAGDHSSVEPDSAAPEGSELEDVLAIRRVLEVGAAELAAEQDLSASQRRSLTYQLRAAERAKTEEYRRYDSRLHLAIAEAAGAPSLMQAIADARTRVNTLLDRIPLLTTNLQHSNSQHRMIIDAILGGEVDRARNAMIEHLLGSAALLRGFLG